jgi:C1A family cysteine protease
MAHHFGWKPDLPDYRDHKLAAFEPINVAVPAMVDLRSGDSPIRDQGQLGSCTAFTGEGSFHYLNNKQGLPDMLGSPLFLYYVERVDQGTVPHDSGATIREICKALAKYGIAPESDWPYDISKFTQQPPQKSYADALQHKVVQYLSVAQQLDQMKSCLASGYPIMIGFTVYENFETPPTSTTGMVQMPQGGVLGGHANLLVGYDDHRQVFISRNSWGTQFGDRGYVYFPYGYLTNPDLARDFWTLRNVTGTTPIPTPTGKVVSKVTTTVTFNDGTSKTETVFS